MGLDAKLTHKALASYKWYRSHIAQMTEKNKVFLLVANKKQYTKLNPQEDSDLGSAIIDVNDFVLMHRDIYPELDNFLGFDQDEDN